MYMVTMVTMLTMLLTHVHWGSARRSHHFIVAESVASPCQERQSKVCHLKYGLFSFRSRDTILRAPLVSTI